MNSVAARMQAGDQEAFAELYCQFRGDVLRLCRYLLGSWEDADDATSEVFARLPRAIKTYDCGQPFGPWLAGVASHYCVDLMRRRHSEQRVLSPADPEVPEPAAPVASPFEELLSTEEKHLVREAIEQLPERYFVPLVMRYYSNRSYNEIAEILGISRINVAVLIFRAKEGLRRLLARKGARRAVGAPGSVVISSMQALRASRTYL